MGMTENWNAFLNMTKAKAESHSKVAQYWDSVQTYLSLVMIFLSAMTTLATLLPISDYVAAGLGAAATLVSAVTSTLNPSGNRQSQMEAAKAFRSLMLKMVRVETDQEYEELWREYNKELLGEPFLPKKYKVPMDTDFSMSPEFLMVVKKKEADTIARLAELGVDGPGVDDSEYLSEKPLGKFGSQDSRDDVILQYA